MWKTHLTVHLNTHLITSVCFKKQKKGWRGEMMPNYCPSVDDRDLISAFSVWIIALEFRLFNNCSFLHFPAFPLQLHIKVPRMFGSVCMISVPFHWSVCLSCLDLKLHNGPFNHHSLYSEMSWLFLSLCFFACTL